MISRINPIPFPGDKTESEFFLLHLAKKKRRLATRFHLFLVLPLIAVSIAVTVMSFRALQNNARHLADVLRIESKTNRILSLLLMQDDASKAMLIDPDQLEMYSSKKIEAYDNHKQLLIELRKEAASPRFQELLRRLQEIDEQKLRPIDSQVLEKLYENVDEARRMYFSRYEAEKQEYELLIRELAHIGAEDLQTASLEQHANNQQSLLQITGALLLGIVLVITAIHLLSAAVEKSDANTKSLLSVLSEGLFFFDSEGRIAAERSQTLGRILPGSEHLYSLQDFVDRYKPTLSRNVPAALRMLWGQSEDFVNDIDGIISLLPLAFTLENQRVIHLEYRPLRSSRGILKSVVVVVADVTEKLQRERESILQAERVRKISRAAAQIDDYLAFVDETMQLFRHADGLFMQANETAILPLKRDLHTLKGSMATAEFNHLASAFHELETLIEASGLFTDAVRQRWALIKDQWQVETADIAQVLGLGLRMDRVSIPRNKFEGLVQHARRRQDRELQDLLRDAQRLPIHEVFAKYLSHVEKLAERLGTKQVTISFAADSTEIAAAEIQKLDIAFVHILRNSVDHGIETPEVRRQLGKDARGTIQWAVYRRPDGSLQVVIRDDGYGVNGDLLARKALQIGHWSEVDAQKASHQDKVNLIFVAELSSRDEVTELSGRGVGMDVVKELIERLGGRITVSSEPGEGTQFEIEVPAA